MATEPRASKRGLSVTTLSTTPKRAKTRPTSAPMSSSSTTGSSGCLVRWMNDRQLALAGFTLSRLVDGGAQ